MAWLRYIATIRLSTWLLWLSAAVEGVVRHEQLPFGGDVYVMFGDKPYLWQDLWYFAWSYVGIAVFSGAVFVKYKHHLFNCVAILCIGKAADQFIKDLDPSYWHMPEFYSLLIAVLYGLYFRKKIV